jgi:hypothetical protein
MEKRYKRYVETRASRDDLNYISPGNAGRPDGESSARRRHRPVEPPPREQSKKLQRGLPWKSRQPEKKLMGYALSRVLTLKLNKRPVVKK